MQRMVTVVEDGSTSEVVTSKTAGSSQASSQFQVGSAVQSFTVDIKTRTGYSSGT